MTCSQFILLRGFTRTHQIAQCRELAEHVQALLSFVHKNANRVLKTRDNVQKRETGSVFA
jgi:hypothetical protein